METAPEARSLRPRAWWGGLATLAALAVPLLFSGLDRPAFFDNEGRYAEVGREMVLLGDWVTPHLNFHTFLNKPPLLFWLVAAYFRAVGLDEGVRIWPALAALATLTTTYALGALLIGVRAGLLAALALLTSTGFLLEARTLRPDMLLTAGMWAALLFALRGERAETRRAAWMAACYAAMGVAILAKGLLGVVLPGAALAAVAGWRDGWRGVRRLEIPLGIAVLAAVVVPWHAAAGARNAGFLWDYVINQHLFSFLATKIPRDSDGDTLVFFWSAFVLRAFPWSVFLPVALTAAVAAIRRQGPAAPLTLVTTFVLGTLAFFSLTSSRLEHYCVPALPGAALLTGAFWDAGLAGRWRAWERRWVALSLLVVAAGSLAGLWLVPGLLAREYWMLQVPTLLDLVWPAFGALAAGAALALGCLATRRLAASFAAVAVTAVMLFLVVYRAHVAVEPLFSWKPIAERLRAERRPGDRVVFEAPVEYQLCAGLNFYLRDRVQLVRPPGFEPPGYLRAEAPRMFLSRADLEAAWGGTERVFLVTDPLQRREYLDGTAPGPYTALGRWGDRWLLTNRPSAN